MNNILLSSKNTLSIVFSLSLTFCFINTIFGQMPPINVTTSTSAGANTDLPCWKHPPVTNQYSATFTMYNNFAGAIAITDFTADDVFFEDLCTNYVTSVTFDNDGFVNGYPTWNPGSHSVTITFANKIRSTLPYNTFTLGTTIDLVTLVDRQVRQYQGSGCFKASVLKGYCDEFQVQKKYTASQTNLSKLNDYDAFDIQGVSKYAPKLLLQINDSAVPYSIFIASITNPGMKSEVMSDANLTEGVNEILLPKMPSGIYQIIVTQGNKIKTIKYSHIAE